MFIISGLGLGLIVRVKINVLYALNACKKHNIEKGENKNQK